IDRKKDSGWLRTWVVVSTRPAATPIWSRRSQGVPEEGGLPCAGGRGGGVVMWRGVYVFGLGTVKARFGAKGATLCRKDSRQVRRMVVRGGRMDRLVRAYPLLPGKREAFHAFVADVRARAAERHQFSLGYR